MTIAPAELTYLRKNTTAFIAADYRDVALSHRSTTPNGSGGYEESYTAVDAQRMRLIPLQDKTPLRTTLDGEAVQPSYMLLGEWNADLQRWDVFADGNNRYQVVYVHEKSSYERKGEVIYLGPVEA